MEPREAGLAPVLKGAVEDDGADDGGRLGDVLMRAKQPVHHILTVCAQGGREAQPGERQRLKATSPHTSGSKRQHGQRLSPCHMRRVESERRSGLCFVGRHFQLRRLSVD